MRSKSLHPDVPSSPSMKKRLAYFVGGALVGGFLGYGLISTSPGEALSMFAYPGAAWVFGGAAIVGVLAGLGTDRVWRRSRGFMLSERDD
jgi:hypothetical protein